MEWLEKEPLVKKSEGEDPSTIRKLITFQLYTKELHLWNFIYAAVLVGLSAGLGFGYVAIKPAFIKSGVYDNLCDKENPPPCNAQDLRLNLMFQIMAGGLNLLALPVGLTLDLMGRRNWTLLATMIWITGVVGLGFANSRTFDVYIESYLLMGIGGFGFFFGILTFGNDWPKRRSMIVSLISVLWDLSSGIFYGYRLLYEYAHLSLKLLFLGYAILVGTPRLIFSIFAIGNITNDAKQPIQKKKFNLKRASTKWLKLLLAPEYLACVAAMSFQMLHMYFFFSTVEEQAKWLTDSESDASKLVVAFSIMLPVEAVVSFPVLGYIRDKTTPVQAFFILAMGGVLWSITSLLPYFWLQFFTYFVYVPWRLFIFVVTPTFLLQLCAVRKQPETFGRLYGLTLSCSGVLVLTSYGWNYLIVHKFNDSFFGVNLGLSIADIGITLLLVLILWLKGYNKSQTNNSNDDDDIVFKEEASSTSGGSFRNYDGETIDKEGDQKVN